eukprot:COSAG06_NODE_718_length_12828_cov_122.309215_13_plen_96_part_00
MIHENAESESESESERKKTAEPHRASASQPARQPARTLRRLECMCERLLLFLFATRCIYAFRATGTEHRTQPCRIMAAGAPSAAHITKRLSKGWA